MIDEEGSRSYPRCCDLIMWAESLLILALLSMMWLFKGQVSTNAVKISIIALPFYSSCLFLLFIYSLLHLAFTLFIPVSVRETEGSDSSTSHHALDPLNYSPPRYLTPLIIRLCNLRALPSQALIIHVEWVCISVNESRYFFSLSFAVISSWYSVSQAQKHQFSRLKRHRSLVRPTAAECFEEACGRQDGWVLNTE